MVFVSLASARPYAFIVNQVKDNLVTSMVWFWFDREDVNNGDLAQPEFQRNAAESEQVGWANLAVLRPSTRVRENAGGVGGIVAIERATSSTGRTLQQSKSEGTRAYQATST